MVRGRIAADADFFAEPPERPRADALVDDDWGAEDYWDEPPHAHVNLTEPGRSDVDDDQFGDVHSEEYTHAVASGPWDDLDDLDEPSAVGLGTTTRTGARRRLLLVGVSGLVVAAGLGIVVLHNGQSQPTGPLTPTSASLPSPTAPQSSVSPSAAAPWQPGKTISGSGAGDLTSGAGVILGFQHAYYTLRQGDLAAQFLVPEQNTAAVVAALQARINEQTVEHQVTVTATDVPNVWDVLVQLSGGDGAQFLPIYQRITVTERAGRFYLAAKKECGTQPCTN